jgi:hypothetical protein
MFSVLRKLFGTRDAAESAQSYPESKYAVTVDEGGVTCTHPDGKVESIAWSEVRQVLVEYSEDHIGIDVWVLLAQRGGCVIPMGTNADKPLREAFTSRLPGFNWSAALDAARTKGPVQVWQTPAA